MRQASSVSPKQAPLAGQAPALAPHEQPAGPETRVWPDALLEAFCLRMSSRGMCVSRALMQNDRRYGLEQLAHAHNMADDTLRMMAVQLFRQFEAHQSGIPDAH